MNTPKRKRIKGWTMPDEAVYVGHPTRWGNPFNWREIAVQPGYETQKENDIDPARRKWILNHLDELRGKDLACWCKPGEPCHADVLLRMANK